MALESALDRLLLQQIHLAEKGELKTDAVVAQDDMELVGVPYHIIVGERNLDEQKVELKNRLTGEKLMLALSDVVAQIKSF